MLDSLRDGPPLIWENFKVKIGAWWQVCSILWLDEKQRNILNTDISDLRIRVDPNQENYDCLWRLLNEPIICLLRSFNISLWRKRWKEVIQWLFKLWIDYSEISKIRLLHRDKTVNDSIDFPVKLNSTTTKEVRDQINNITLKPLREFNWESIEVLLAWALPTQTFWEFSMHCLKNWIKLEP